MIRGVWTMKRSLNAGRLPRVPASPFSNTRGISPPQFRFPSERRMIMGRPRSTDEAFLSGGGPQLSCTLCAIIPVGDDWIVQCGTATQGPFMTKGRALRLAFAEAMTLRARGQRSRVSVQDGSGGVSTEHCLCAAFQAARRFGASTSTP